MPKQNLRKPPTNFTIDCILSKAVCQNEMPSIRDREIHIPMNKVLDNNPWIPRNPLALAFNPGSFRKFTFPSTSSIDSPDLFKFYQPSSFENVVKLSQKYSSIPNHCFPSLKTTTTNRSSDYITEAHQQQQLQTDINPLPKLNVYETESCDSASLNNFSLDLSDHTKSSYASSPSIYSDFKCLVCFKSFENVELLDAHGKTHLKPKYECNECQKKFSQLRNYKYHMSIHRGTKEFAASCNECGKIFNDKGYLSSHMKIHRNKKEYLCPYCPKSFNQRVAFNMHVRIHLGLKPHCCSDCGKTFSRKMLLKQHYRTHSGEKPYICSQSGCGKQFADRSNMILHFRLHSGVKPFACPLCPKRFSKKHHLGTHMNYHTGNKPYVCPHTGCGQKFTQSSNMRTHSKKCQHKPTN